jgi:hypothetical protein
LASGTRGEANVENGGLVVGGDLGLETHADNELRLDAPLGARVLRGGGIGAKDVDQSVGVTLANLVELNRIEDVKEVLGARPHRANAHQQQLLVAKIATA